MCEWLKKLKVPSRFYSSIQSFVSMKDLALTNYNSHDCHVMLTTFLPIAIRAINPMFLKMVVTRLCYFFNKIIQKVIEHDELEFLQELAVETVSQFDMCFPHHSLISYWCTLWCTWFHKYTHCVPCTYMKCVHTSVLCQY